MSKKSAVVGYTVSATWPRGRFVARDNLDEPTEQWTHPDDMDIYSCLSPEVAANFVGIAERQCARDIEITPVVLGEPLSDDEALLFLQQNISEPSVDDDAAEKLAEEYGLTSEQIRRIAEALKCE